MRFAEIQGNNEVKRAFAGMVDSGRIPHAILLHEDDGCGGFAFAQAFLGYLYCANHSSGDACGTCPACSKIARLIHPDVHYIFPVNSGLSQDYIAEFRNLVRSNPYFTEAQLQDALELEGKNTMIKVDEAKALISTLSLCSLEGGYSSIVVYLPEKMNREAANRLLKLVEEPPEKTQFIFITHSPEAVLPTISSRCQRIRILPGGVSGAGAGDEEFAELFSSLMDAMVARRLVESLDQADRMASLASRERMKAFCAYGASCMRDIFLAQQGMGAGLSGNTSAGSYAGRCSNKFPRKALDAFSRAQMLIERNVSPKILFTDLVDRLYTSII